MKRTDPDVPRGGWILIAVCCLLPLALPGAARGWGEDGHRLVCEIAFQELTEEARREVIELIAIDPAYSTFSESCNWADKPIRQNPPEHFINVPRSFTYIGAAACRVGRRCTFTGINRDARILERASAPRRRLQALKLLGHWVGDIHQPLHVSFKDDKGGNDINESEEDPCKWSLHSVWDTCILRERVLEGRSIRQAAEELRARIDGDDRERLRDSTMVGWADESFKIAISEEVGYCFQIEEPEVCAYDLDNPTLELGEEERGFSVDQEYLDLHGDRVAQRILSAGVRLAGLLNERMGQ